MDAIKVPVEILSSDQWKAFRDIRLHALRDEPLAFGRSYEEEAGFSQKSWKEELSYPRRVYGAMIDGNLIAIGGVKFRTGERYNHTVSLFGLYVDPRFRGQGVGKGILQRMIADLRDDPGVHKIELSVNQAQSTAKNMYQKLGFREIGVAKDDMKIGGVYYDSAKMELLFADKK